MAKIRPFKAVRPTQNNVDQVVSRSYTDYTPEERHKHITKHPNSFLRIIDPGYDTSVKTPLFTRYAKVRERFLSYKNQGIFIQDTTPCYYVYQITTPQHVYCGIIALASTQDYEDGVIKKHENTLHKKEIAFKNYLERVQFNAEPVLLTYPDNPVLMQVIEAVKTHKATYSFTTTDPQHHQLWAVADIDIVTKIGAIFESIDTLYIADGHHRCASSYVLSKATAPTPKPTDFFMSYLIPTSDLRITEFNRLVKDLNGLSENLFLKQLETHFSITPKGTTPYKPQQSHEFSMYLDGCFYQLKLKSPLIFDTPVDELDTQILYTTILQPILGIENLRNNDRILYYNGLKGQIFMQKKVDSGTFRIGFGLYPISFSQLKTIADQGLKMPPKSTYILPKLKSGLTIYEF